MAGRGNHLVQPAWMTRESKTGPEPFQTGDLGARRDQTREETRSERKSPSRRSDRDERRSSGGGDSRSRRRSRERSSRMEYRDKRSRSSRRDDDDESRHKRSRRRDRESKGSASEYPLPKRQSRLPPGFVSMWDKGPDDLPGTNPGVAALPSQIIGKPGAVIPNLKETRHARRIYVGGIGDANAQMITEFFNDVILRGLGRRFDSSINFVQSVYVQTVKNYAFVELKSVEIAAACMALDGIEFRNNPLRINRPNDYKMNFSINSDSIPVFDLAAINGKTDIKNRSVPDTRLGESVSSQGISSIIIDGPNKLFVGGLPHHMRDPEIIELLESFGRLKALKVIREDEERSKGYCFCEYMDPANTDRAIEGLNDLEIGTRKLKVRRSNPDSILSSSGPSIGTAASPLLESEPTKVLVLWNVVSREELANDDDYAEIVEDIREEASNYCPVKSIEVPRDNGSGNATPGVGNVYIEFLSPVEATVVRFRLEGRVFGGKKVSCGFIEYNRYLNKEF